MVLMGMDLPLAAVRGQIASGVDIMIHLGRMRDRTRKVLQICEVEGVKDGEIVLHRLYEFQESGEKQGIVQGNWRRTGTLKNREKLKGKGVDRKLDEIYEKTV